MRTAKQVLERAAMLCGPESYHRHASGAVCNPDTARFSVTGLVERANCGELKSSGQVVLPWGHDRALAAAKAAACRRVGAVHLDAWEAEKRPDWREVRQAFLEAAR